MSHLIPTATVAHCLATVASKARDYAARGVAESTRRAYGSDWSAFEEWCGAHGLSALPAAPETVPPARSVPDDVASPVTMMSPPL